MKAGKRKKLEAAGWKVGSERAFLGLSDEEAAFVELKLTLRASSKEEFESWEAVSDDDSLTLEHGMSE